MFDSSSVSSVNTGSNYTPLVNDSSSSLDTQEGFLTLLIAELQNQDPLEPLKNQEYISQLTQFSMLDELREVNSNLETEQAGQVSNFNVQSLNLIGKEITVLDDTIEHQVGNEVQLSFQLPSDETVSVNIYNSRGVLVRQDAVVGSHLSGWQEYTFDGKDNNGNYLADGTYYVEVVTPTDIYGNAEVYPVYQTGRVTGVDFTGSETILELEGGQQVPLANVAGVREIES